jgi:hypothetical protein
MNWPLEYASISDYSYESCLYLLFIADLTVFSNYSYWGACCLQSGLFLCKGFLISCLLSSSKFASCTKIYSTSEVRVSVIVSALRFGANCLIESIVAFVLEKGLSEMSRSVSLYIYGKLSSVANILLLKSSFYTLL